MIYVVASKPYGPGSVVGIATGYGLNGLGIESQSALRHGGGR
jgi:hypothetical protein